MFIWGSLTASGSSQIVFGSRAFAGYAARCGLLQAYYWRALKNYRVAGRRYFGIAAKRLFTLRQPNAGAHYPHG